MKYIKKFFLCLFYVFLLFYLISEIPGVKKFAIQQGINLVNKKTNFDIHYEELSYKNIRDISFFDVSIKDKNDDRFIINLKELRLNINLAQFFIRRQIHFTNLDFINLTFHVDENKNIIVLHNKELINFNFFKFFSIKIDNANFANCAILLDNVDNENLKKYNLNHLNISKINSQIQKVIITDSQISGSIEKLSAACQKFLLQNLSVNLKYSDDKVQFEKLNIDSNYGKLIGEGNLYNVNNLEKFYYDLELQNFNVIVKNIPYFKSLDSNFNLYCKAKGNSIDNTIEKCNIRYKKNLISFTGNVKNCNNIKDIKYKINQFSGNIDLNSFDKNFAKKVNDILPLKRGEFRGKISGKGQNGKLTLDLRSNIGEIISDINFVDVFSENRNFDGDINLKSFNLPNWGIKNIFSQHKIKVSQTENTLVNKISTLQYNDVDIKNIDSTIQGTKDHFDGSLQIDDENFKTNLNIKNYDDTIYCFGHLDLKNLDTVLKTKGKIDIKNDVDVKIKIKTNDINVLCNNNVIAFRNSILDVKNLKAHIERDNKYFQISLFSDFLDIKIQNIPDNFKSIANDIAHFYENLIHWIKKEPISDYQFTNCQIPFFINLKNDKIFSLLKSNIKCDKTNIYGEYLNVNNKNFLNLNVDKIQNLEILDNSLINSEIYVTLGFNNDKKIPIVNLLCEIDKISTDGIYIDNIFTKISSHDDKIKIDLSLQNNIFKLICALDAFFKDGEIIFDLTNKNNSSKFNKWTLVNDGFISIGNKNIVIKNIKFVKNDMYFVGNYNLDFGETGWENRFLLQAQNIKLQNYKKYIRSDIDGIINGKIKKNNSALLNIDLNVNDFKVKQNDLGNINLKTNYNTENQIYNYSLLIKTIPEDNVTLNIKGSYFNKNKSIKAKCFFDKFDLKTIEFLTIPICDKLSGFIKGTLNIFGTFNRPKFLGNLELINGNILFTNLKSEYTTRGFFQGNADSLKIVDLEVKDEQGGTGLFNGKIKINFTDIPTLDLTGKVDKIHILNTTAEDNPIFYGNIFCSGNTHFFGPVNFLTIACNVQNEKKSKIYLNLNKGDKNNGFIHFSEKEDQNKIIKNFSSNEKKNGIKLDLHAKINNDLITFLKIPQSTLNVLGNGELYINTTFNDDLNIQGDFTIDKGEYLFSFENLVQKKFHIQNDSHIKFSGDFNLTTLNVTAEKKVFLDDDIDTNFVILKILCEGLINDIKIKYDIDLSKGKISANLKNKIKNENDLQNQFINLFLFDQFQSDSLNLRNNYINKNIEKKFNKNNKIRVNFESSTYSLDNVKYDVKYIYGNKFIIKKRQKYLNKNFSIDDLMEDFNISYKINNDINFFASMGHEKNINLGFQISY